MYKGLLSNTTYCHLFFAPQVVADKKDAKGDKVASKSPEGSKNSVMFTPMSGEETPHDKA